MNDKPKQSLAADNSRKIALEAQLFKWLDVLAAHCPFERVDLWTERSTNGRLNFTAFANGVAGGNGSAVLPVACASGSTPQEAVKELMKRHPDRNPSRWIAERIAKLQMEIEKLKQLSTTLVLAPMRQPMRLAPGGDEPPVPPSSVAPKPSFIDVEQSSEYPWPEREFENEHD